MACLLGSGLNIRLHLRPQKLVGALAAPINEPTRLDLKGWPRLVYLTHCHEYISVPETSQNSPIMRTPMRRRHGFHAEPPLQCSLLRPTKHPASLSPSALSSLLLPPPSITVYLSHTVKELRSRTMTRLAPPSITVSTSHTRSRSSDGAQ
jgi:hypothetical protein